MDSYQVAAISIAGLSLLVSILSLLTSISNYHKNLTLNRQVKLLNDRKTVAEHFSFYINLVHSEFFVLRDDFSNMSSLCVMVNDDIGNILDTYDTRPSILVKTLRGLYYDLYRGICAAFEPELPWQNAEHLRLRLTDIRFLLAVEKLQNADTRRRWPLFMVNRRKAAYPERRFLESEFGRSTFVELVHSLDETKPDELVSSIRSSFDPIHEFFEKHTQKLANSLHALESGLVKNKLEEFRLSENPELYRKYKLFMNTLRFLLHCTASPHALETASRYWLVTSIVVLGSTIAMSSSLISKTIFTINE